MFAVLCKHNLVGQVDAHVDGTIGFINDGDDITHGGRVGYHIVIFPERLCRNDRIDKAVIWDAREKIERCPEAVQGGRVGRLRIGV
jgi:hypothetical protein